MSSLDSVRKAATHNDRVLARLQKGPATASELYNLGCIAHSRISDLRKRGHEIECVRVKGEGASAYVYTLIPTGRLF